MGNERYGHGGAAGILSAVALLVAFAIAIPTPPDIDASANAWAGFYTDHQDAIRVGMLIISVGILLFIWFLGSLRVALTDAEGGSGRLASIAYGGGLIAAATLTVGVAASEAAALRPDQLDPATTRALNDVFVVIAAPAASAIVAFFAATAAVGFRHGGLPSSVTWLCAIAAVGQLPAYGAAMTTTGAFAGDGVLGLIVPVLTFIVGVVALGVALVRAPAAATAP